jgi:gluconokinase
MTTICLVVMGVSGAGKTTVARNLADRLGWSFGDADEHHSEASVEKMKAEIPLTDEDRLPWLRDVRDWIDEQNAKGENTILACSALKRAYRDILREAEAHLVFVRLTADYEVLASRLGSRTGHFMPSRLLDSQLGDLEPLEPDEAGITVDVSGSPEQIVAAILKELHFSGEQPTGSLA